MRTLPDCKSAEITLSYAVEHVKSAIAKKEVAEFLMDVKQDIKEMESKILK